MANPAAEIRADLRPAIPIGRYKAGDQPAEGSQAVMQGAEA